MSDTKRQLLEFLQRVSSGIENQAIQKEAHLEQLVRIQTTDQIALWEIQGLQKTESSATLLEILGYSGNDVEDHPKKKTVVGQISFAPDYVLKAGQKDLAVLDLKAPEETLDKEKWFGQIHSYYDQIKAPIGILFNGHSVRVYINVGLKGLANFREIFANQPVAMADFKKPKEMVELLLKLEAANLKADAVAVARKLAASEKRRIEDTHRQEKIRKCITEALLNPSDDVIAALLMVDGLWQDFDPVPTETQLLTAWSNRKEPSLTVAAVKSTAKLGVNVVLRQKVADVCASKGWDYLMSHPIKGLSYHNAKEKGYQPVPARTGVPVDLHVRGVSAETAERIIQQLDKL